MGATSNLPAVLMMSDPGRAQGLVQAGAKAGTRSVKACAHCHDNKGSGTNARFLKLAG